MKVIREKIIKPAMAAVIETVTEEVEEGLATFLGKRICIVTTDNTHRSMWEDVILTGVNATCVKVTRATTERRTSVARYKDSPLPPPEVLRRHYYIMIAAITAFWPYDD